MAWLGIGDASKIAIIAMAVFYPTFINSYYGAKGVSQSHLRAAQNMGATPGRIFWLVIFPSALPQISLDYASPSHCRSSYFSQPK